ncbi:MAG: hypothetical protein AAF720_00825 [Pseudomonadota bacterium]
MAVNIPRSIVVHSDEDQQRQDDEEAALRSAEKRMRDRQSRFIQSFGHHLTGEQSTKFEYLARCFQIREASNNARAAYDGVGIPDTFASKDVPGRVIDAGTFIQSCERAIVRDVQMLHPSAWRLVEHAVKADMNASEASRHYVVNILRDTVIQKRDPSSVRKKVLKIVQLCGQAIEHVEAKKKYAD